MRHVLPLAFALLTVGTGACHPPTEPTPPPLDIDASSLAIDRVDGIAADGEDAATLAVSLVAPGGGPLANADFSLNVTGTDNTLTFSGKTDAGGKASARLTTTTAEVKVIYASLGKQLVKQRVSARFVAGSASRLDFLVQPGPAAVHVALAPAVVVAAVDRYGNVADTGTAVAVSLSGGAAGATLGGVLQHGATHGRATFTDLAVSAAGQTYQLTAVADGLTAATSLPFAITDDAAPSLAFAVQPSSVAAGAAMAPAVVVVARDAAGNVVDSDALTVGLALGSAGGGTGTLGGTRYQTTAHGRATFADLYLDVAGRAYTLAASAAGVSGATSANFDVVAGPPCRCNTQFSATPTAAAADGATAIALRLVVHDDHGNVVPDAAVNFSSPEATDQFRHADGSTATDGFITDSAGTCLAQVVGTVPGSRQVTADFGDQAPRTVAITFTP